MNSIPSRNPYGHLTAIRNPKLFVGRTHELRRLYAAIADQQCISIVGTRRIGKSSILCCMRLPEMVAIHSSSIVRVTGFSKRSGIRAILLNRQCSSM